MELVQKASLINKEQIPQLHFRPKEVLLSIVDKKNRYRDSYLAMMLGNDLKQKVHITFETEEGLHEVFTTIWMASEESLLLKNGVRIPMRSIRKVEF